MLTADNALLIMSQMLKVGMTIAAPVLAISLLVGLIVSIFQVITQVQEMTLTFVPKLIAAIFILIAFSSWMLSKWLEFAASLFQLVASV